jgi:hypothetical protein
VTIVPGDKEFSSLPWDAVTESLGVSIEHPELRDEHLSRIGKIPHLRGVELVCNPELTASGLESLISPPRLDQVAIDGRALRPGEWRFLQSLREPYELKLQFKPEQVKELGESLRGVKPERLTLDVDSNPAFDARFAPYGASGPVPMTLDTSGMRELIVAGGWIRESDLVSLIRESPELWELTASVDRISPDLIEVLREKSNHTINATWCSLAAPDAPMEVVRCNITLRLPRLTQELATAFRNRDPTLPPFEIVLPDGNDVLPADTKGLASSMHLHELTPKSAVYHRVHQTPESPGIVLHPPMQ